MGPPTGAVAPVGPALGMSGRARAPKLLQPAGSWAEYTMEVALNATSVVRPAQHRGLLGTYDHMHSPARQHTGQGQG